MVIFFTASLRAKTEHSPLTQGTWSDGTPWSFYVYDQELDDDKITAVFCIVTFESKVAVIKHKQRGWEIPGGHREDFESPLEAIRREIREETGLVIHNVKLFGHKEVKPLVRIPKRETGQFYPYPTSYVPYYHAQASEHLADALGDDVESVELLSYATARERLQNSKQNHHVIIEHLLKVGAIELA